jgi:hypothetical protein
MLLHSARSTHATRPVIDSDRDDWWRLARCADPRDRNMWTADALDVRLAAAHQCIAHCPVVARCHQYARDYAWTGMAVGGVVYGYDGLPLDVEPQPCQTCRPALRIAMRHPLATLKLCERCGREFLSDHPARRQCRTEECERARWRESRRRGRAELSTANREVNR